MNKILKIHVLLSAFLTFAVFLPDSDTFAAQFSVAPHLLDHLIIIDDDRLNSTYPKLLILLFVGLAVLGFSIWSRYRRLAPMILGSAALIAYGVLRSQMSGMPLGASLRSLPLIGIYLMVLSTIAVAGHSADRRVVSGIGLGFLASGSIKLVYAVYCYRRYGGVQIFEGTSALAMDGGLLIQWAVIAGGASMYGLHFCLLRKYVKSALLFLVGMIFSAAVAASFRRTALVLVLGNLGMAIIIYFWLKRRFLVGIMWLGSISLAAGVGLFVVMASVFGFTTAYERVLSLSKSANSANSFSDSNEVYLDDQNALVDIVMATGFAGSGPGVPYGVSRKADQFTTEGYIPLHIGTAELWASFGIVGIAYHLIILFLLPLLCLRYYRARSFVDHKSLVGDDVVPFTIVASYVLLSAFWPFAPPFYFNCQTSIIIGVCFGYLLGATARVNLVRRSPNGQVATPVRSMATLPA